MVELADAYDGRGFLTSETHPELGTSLLYSDYGPLGNPGRIRRGGWDLNYAYDPAGRLTEIKERGTTRVWKSWDYATGNFQAGQWSNGKLRSAERHNRVLVPGTSTEFDAVVTESYQYGGVGGRISSVQTTAGVGDPADNTRPVFTYSLAYDPLRSVTSRTQPRCTFNFCTGSPADVSRTVTGTYAQGLLAAVPGYASFSYDGAGNITKMGSHRYVYDLLSRIDARPRSRCPAPAAATSSCSRAAPRPAPSPGRAAAPSGPRGATGSARPATSPSGPATAWSWATASRSPRAAEDGQLGLMSPPPVPNR